MRIHKFLFLLSVILSTSGCAIGPLVLHESARTVGNSNSEIIGGYGQAGGVFKWNYGLTDNLDIGVHWESLSLGVRAKYAFINSKSSGWSMASAIGTGRSFGGSHYYADLILSHFSGSWEPYSALRFVHVKNDPLEFKNKDTGAVDFTIKGSEYDYGQIILGSRYWFDKSWLFSLEASTFTTLSSEFIVDTGLIVGGAFGYRF